MFKRIFLWVVYMASFFLILSLLYLGYFIIINFLTYTSLNTATNISQSGESEKQISGGFTEKITFLDNIQVVLKQNSRHEFYGTPIIYSRGNYSNSFLDIFDLERFYLPLQVNNKNYIFYHNIFLIFILPGISLLISIFLSFYFSKTIERRENYKYEFNS